MTAPTLADLRYAFFGGGPGKTVSDAEYQQLVAMYNSGISLASLAASSSLAPVGELQSLPRSEIRSNAVATVNQELLLTHFVASSSMTVGRLVMYSGTTAAGATPTLVRWGIYEVEADNDCALIASIPSDTGIFAAANTEYVRALSANVALLAGKRYAVGTLIVTAAALPSVVGSPSVGPAIQNSMKLQPTVASQMGGQADLPATASFGSVNGTDGRRFYTRLLGPV